MNTQCLGKNKRSVSVYCTVLQVAGWVLLVGGVLSSACRLIAVKMDSRIIHNILLSRFVVDCLYPGILAIGLAQLITYIFDREYQPGWLLRRADKIVYLYATLILLSGVLHHVYILSLPGQANSQQFTICAVSMLLLVAKLVILIGLGRLLRLVMPMIEESRALI